MGKRSREDGEDSVTSSQDVLLDGQSPAKIIEFEDEEFGHPGEATKMQCLLPPHLPLHFNSTEEFDVHYVKEHTNRCSSCRRNFPSAHYLDLHIDENHNPVRESLAANGEKTYACFIEDCEKLCSTPQKRRLHLIDKHMFPKAYNFRIIDKGIDKTDSMLRTGPRRRFSIDASKYRSRRLSNVNERVTNGNGLEDANEDQSAQEVKPLSPALGDANTDISELATKMTALNFVPSSVRAKQRPKKTAK